MHKYIHICMYTDIYIYIYIYIVCKEIKKMRKGKTMQEILIQRIFNN